ncbi:ferrous iron transport protein B [Paenibacillus larvae subsp. larvae]|uniref:Ferrous iron transport protein B n=1 Tax=Paenibacillus larvae subsp. larvae TaxID=147375 RepID=A0A2L1U5B9_9BACL|nr:ferrous iron transport protein B [Paenibacillus larvae]AQT84428.1 ferrous iron transport protein B [Paenibacillus larvae subsp. pulvifaciens]AQZ46423.1 ferrous iron transport protein B [Paenibacillus larvae subsp. pulvifaciens]AVF28113.1 ferrous iron transport protein B [Paenibacillus larvae subsp. larvae]AVF32616.1 ferrous iron transport protein B [Paenibacillus larvae subsp. larvae]MBH0343885.1 ferrous iron transporter B [Paenibacillus larvae]
MNKVALLGNPNTGKTSLFNALTGSYEYVGNWSGVTVEKKVGKLKDKQGILIDLPGVYDLNPVSRDEGVVTNFLLKEEFHHMLNIVDSSQFERNMHLTLQLLELGKPLFIGLNMIDVAKQRGIVIDAKRLSEILGVTVVPVVARSGKGCDELLATLHESKKKDIKPFILSYGEQVDTGIANITKLLMKENYEHPRCLAIQFLSNNEVVEQEVLGLPIYNDLISIRSQLEAKLDRTLEQHIYETRVMYIEKLKTNVMWYEKEGKIPFSEKIDKLITHKIFGLPIFLGVMFFIFQVTFTWVGTPLSDIFDNFIGGQFTDWVTSGLASIGASGFIQDLINDGIIAGVGAVLVFVPQIFVLFFFISLLEDSGYMARIAVVMDRIMEFFGLNGKAFIPMIIGFGCNVPGIMAARTIEQEKERLLTVLVTPFMSCSARLPIYALFAGVFFPHSQATVVFSLYIAGIILALLVTKIMSITILKKEKSIFVIELPPYRIPQAKTLWLSTWDKGKGFVRKAGTFIFGGSVIIWLLNYAGPSGFGVEMGDSFLALIGGVIAPLLAPLGFGTWQAAASLLTGFLAKEVVVSTMAIIYAVKEDVLGNVMGAHYTALSAYAFMFFILLYVPCLATVAVIRRETGSVKWTIFSVVYPLIIAYVLTLVIYQVGSLFGF